MSEHPTLSVRSRAHVGSCPARRLRRQGQIPAVLYGHGAPQAVALSTAEFTHAVPVSQYGSLLVRLVLDGTDAGAALVKAVQTHPLSRTVYSVDLQRVSMDEHVQVSVPVVLLGEPADARRGGVLEQMVHSVTLRCRASDVPANISYDVSALGIGDAVHAGELALPANCELLENPEQLIVLLAAPTVATVEGPVEIPDGVTGPELTGEKQQEDSQLAT
ncbi:MAG TPA: 50S ribosomal protein L25 [Armatimonadota bacterium]|nr:50S ribosomal protein L25 [Armatimonadota bacterium]HOS44022.1 50S ribosomal protein L25 [Armatimonadota bacterium]